MPYNQLTKPIKTWQSWLSWFDEDLQPVIADLLWQLSNFLGTVKESKWCDQMLSSGLGDIRNRGDYQHLLTTEWLIGEEEPDEFIRRAVSNEHLFVTPIYEKSKANGVIIALFDCGLLQLGVPRLAHLILMILFDIRAQQHKSQFYWGIIQSRSKLKLFSGIEDLKLLLNSRTITCIDDNQLDYWHNYLQKSEFFYDECWLIGNNISQIDFATHKVSISRLINHFSKIAVNIVSNKVAKRFELTLPNQVICAKLLSGQFESGSNYGVINQQFIEPININFKPKISKNGDYVLMFNNENNNIHFIGISDALSQRQKCSIKFYQLKLKSKVLAIDIQGKYIFALYQEDQKIFLWGTKGPRKALSEAIQINANHTLSHFLSISRQSMYGYDVTNILYIDDQKVLYSIFCVPKNSEEIKQVEKIAQNVIALFKLSDRHACYIYHNQDQFWIESEHLYHLPYCLKIKSIHDNLQYFISAENLWLTGFGRLAIGFEQQWQVFDNENSYVEVKTPLNWQVFGLFHDYHEDKINFLIINHDKKQVATFDYLNNNIDICLSSSNKIVNYSYNSLAQCFTIITDIGELILYSFLTRSIRLKLYQDDLHNEQ